MGRPGGRGERILVDFFYAAPVGHAIEALHHCLDLHVADPSREIGLILNAAMPTQLADWCPFVDEVYPVEAPFLAPAPQAAASLAAIPDDWDWILDDPRRHEAVQQRLFAGMVDHYAASDQRFTARVRRSVVGYAPLSRACEQQLRLTLPGDARRAARRRLVDQDRAGDVDGGGPTIALMPAGSSPRPCYPSARSWTAILDGLVEAFPGLRVVLVGRLADDGGTSTAFAAGEHVDLLAHPASPVDAFDVPLAEQLALVEAAELFVAPHTGFGMAALALGTPWLSLAGGRWFEWYFNQVPFRSVIPDVTRYPCFGQFAEEEPRHDGDDGLRIASMTRARIDEDLPRLVDAARELVDGAVPYEQCLKEYFADLLAAHGGATSALWSFGGVHGRYV